MFTCVEILPQSESFLEKIRDKIKPFAPEREFVQVRGGTPFLRLKVKQNHIDWQKISAVLSKKERIILTDSTVEVPENSGLVKYTSLNLSTVLMFSAMCRVLEKSKAAQNMSISVFDRNGFLIPFLIKTAPLVRNVTVYTERIREYFYCISKISEETGMSVKLNEYDSLSPAENIIFSDEYLPHMKNADFVFLSDRSVVSHNAVTGHGITLENEYRILKSEAVDDFLFASALYELSGVSDFASRGFKTLRMSGKTVSEKHLSELIR